MLQQSPARSKIGWATPKTRDKLMRKCSDILPSTSRATPTTRGLPACQVRMNDALDKLWTFISKSPCSMRTKCKEHPPPLDAVLAHEFDASRGEERKKLRVLREGACVCLVTYCGVGWGVTKKYSQFSICYVTPALLFLNE